MGRGVNVLKFYGNDSRPMIDYCSKEIIKFLESLKLKFRPLKYPMFWTTSTPFEQDSWYTLLIKVMPVDTSYASDNYKKIQIAIYFDGNYRYKKYVINNGISGELEKDYPNDIPLFEIDK